MLRWCWDKIGTARVVVVSTDPVLRVADAPGHSDGGGRSRHEFCVNRGDQTDRDVLGIGRVLHGDLHRVDVCQHLEYVRSDAAPRFCTYLGARQLSHAHLQSFDPRRRDGFAPQQQAREWRQSRSGKGIQLADGAFGVGNDPGGFRAYGEGLFRKQGWYVRVVAACFSVARWGVQCGVMLPKPAYASRGHASLIWY